MQNIGCRLGGTNLAVAQVKPGGRFRGKIAVRWRERVAPDDADGLVAEMARQIKEVAGEKSVNLIGLSCKGPIRYANGRALVGPCTTLPFQADYPLEEKLRRELQRLDMSYAALEVMLDSVAALLGEVHPKGTLPGATNLAILILGTGVGWPCGRRVQFCRK